MKTVSDAFVSDHLWYLVLAYLHDTGFQPIRDRGLMGYDERGRETFRLGSIDRETFDGLATDAVEHFKSQWKEITLENIEIYGGDD